MSTSRGVMEISVPGRVCLFGEHSDWAGGYRRSHTSIECGKCIVTGTDQKLYARVEEHRNKIISTSTRDDGTVEGPWECAMDQRELLAVAKKGGFWSYVAAVAFQVRTYYPVQGIILDNYLTTLPMKKGLSSSAAVCVMIAVRAMQQPQP